MAEDEIKILIKAVDEATATLKSIEKQVTSTAKSSEQANRGLSDSFSKVQGAMLNLGQVAQGVHQFLEIGEQRTRSLENAQDRLENATLRLKQANQGLKDSYQKLIDIEKKHERDSLTLEQAQLDLEEATKNQKIALRKYGEESVEARQATINLKNAQLDLKDAENLGEQKTRELATAKQDIKDKQDALIISTNNMERSQRALDKVLGDVKWSYLDQGVQMLSVAGNAATLYSTLSKLNGAGGFGGLAGTITKTTGAIGTAGTATAGGAGLLGALGAMAVVGGLAWYALDQAADEHQKKLQQVIDKYGELSKADQMIAMGYEAFQADLVARGQITSQAGPDIPADIKNMQINPNAPSGSYTNISRVALPWVQASMAADTYKEKALMASKGINTSIKDMSVTSNKEIDFIQVNLSQIPTDIYTYHHIVTVYDSGTSKKKK